MALLRKVGIGAPLRGALKVPSVGSQRKAAAQYNPNSAHTHSMLAQASRNPRLTNIASVQTMLRAHAPAGRGGTKK